MAKKKTQKKKTVNKYVNKNYYNYMKKINPLPSIFSLN
jgi:hypothetical protein